VLAPRAARPAHPLPVAEAVADTVPDCDVGSDGRRYCVHTVVLLVML